MRTLLALLLALSSLLAQQSAVKGTVVEDRTGSPLEGVAIQLQGEMADQGQYNAGTSAEGKFAFDGVKPGRYYLQVKLEGYQVSEAPKGLVLVGPNGINGELKLKLAAPSAVSGTVLEDDDKPYSGCSVDLLRNPIGGAGSLQAVASARCKADGTFSFPNVLPGRYYLQARPPDGKSKLGEPTLVPTYYPGSVDIASASRLNVHRGADLTGLKWKLRQSILYRVSGKLLGSDSPARFMIWLMPAATPGSDLPGPYNVKVAVAGGDVRPDGSFTIEGVLPGWHAALAGDRDHGWVASTGFLVKDLDVENLRVSIPSGIPFGGKVVYEGEHVGRVPSQLQLTSYGAGGFRMTAFDIDPDGTFETRELPVGSYRLGVSDSQWSVRKVEISAGSASGGRFDLVTPSADTVITLTTQGERITGRIEGFDPERSPRGTVTAIPVPTTLSEISAMRTAIPDATGAFHLSNLGPETYRVCAWTESGKGPTEVAAHFANQQRLESACASVTVKAGEPQNITLKQLSAADFEP